MLKAALAISAQHLSAFGQFDPILSNKYYQTALESLISVVPSNDTTLNEDLLAATVILRLRAESEGISIFVFPIFFTDRQLMT